MAWSWSFAWEILPAILRGLVVTVEAVILGMSLALVIGLGWAMLRISGLPFLSPAARWLVEFIRSTPLLVQLYFLFFVLPQTGISASPLVTGIVGLGLHYSSYTAEVYRAGIESVPRGQWEAARALGFSRARVWRSVVLPQAIPPVIPALGNYLVAMFKDTPLLAAITVMEMLQVAKLVGAETFRYLEPMTLVGVIFLVLSLVSSRFVRLLEARFGSAAA